MYPPTHELQPTWPPPISPTGKTPGVITLTISSTLSDQWQHPLDTTSHAPSYRLPRRHLQPLPHQLSDNSPSSAPTLPPAAHSRPHSQQCRQSAQPPPRPRPSRSTWLPGRRGIGRRLGRLHPTVPSPLADSAHQLPGGPAIPVGRGFWKKENSRVCPGAGKSLVPTPFPRQFGAGRLFGARGRRSVRARLCAPKSALRGRGGEGRGGGWAPTSAPPPHSPAPRLHVGRPLPRRLRASPAGGSAHPRPARGSRRQQTFSGAPASRAPLPWPAWE